MPPENLPDYMVLINENQADTLVSDMDAWLTQTEPLTSFILPAGGPPQAVLHHARTVARRLERGIVKLREHEGEHSVRPLVLTYVNRLSDWLFVMSRWITAVLGEEEMLWQPLGKRGKEDGIANSILRQAEHDADLTHLICRFRLVPGFAYNTRVSSCVNWASACSQSNHKWSDVRGERNIKGICFC